MITEEGGIAPLITLLKDKHAALKENATKALSHLATNEDNKTAIAKAGGIGPLVTLLTEGNETTQQFTAAALQSLARDHSENQIAIGQAGAITPLANLLGSDARETQEHAVGALLFLASTDEGWRDAVIKCLIGVLDVRSAAAQVKAAEALSILAARSNDNRQAITSAAAVPPLVRLLGDGRRVKAETPQERAACVLADLARLAENKIAIVMAGGISPLVHLLSSESPLAQRHAAGALSQLAAVGLNKGAINEAGAIPPLVQLLKDSSSSEALTKLAASVLWHLTAKEDAKTSMVAAGVIPPLVAMLSSPTPGVRDHAAAVISSLARTSGGSKKAIYSAGGIPPLVELLVSEKPMTQKHAACALWGMSDGKDGVYDKQIAEAEAVRPLVNMMQSFDTETCGFAAACLLCLCKDEEAKEMMLSGGAAEPLLALAHNPSKWLANQAQEMLKLLGIPFTDPEPGTLSPRIMNSPRMGGIAGRPTGRDNQAVCSVAQKTLPIRKESAIDPEMPNPKQGELLKGDFCYVLDRIEVEEGIFRALVATEPAGEPKGWVTAAKEGSEFLIPESAAMMGKDMPNHVKMKFHFFVCQLP
jgi:vacuolar protein 8